MPKITIKTKIINQDYSEENTHQAILNNNKIKYKENNTKVIYDYQNKILTRENNNYKMIFNFSSTKLNIYLKEEKKYLELTLKVKSYNLNNNNLEIEYILDNNKYLYSIEVIE